MKNQMPMESEVPIEQADFSLDAKVGEQSHVKFTVFIQRNAAHGIAQGDAK